MNRRFLKLTGLMLITLLVAVAPIKGQTQRVTNADSGRDNSEVVKVRAEFAVDKTGQNRTLAVTADIRDSFHIYAMTQPKPFIATKVHVDQSDAFTLTTGFTPSRSAKVLGC